MSAARICVGVRWAGRWLVAGAFALALPAQADLEIAVRCGAEEVELGEAFVFEVVRSWRRGLVPEPFDPAQLAPLWLQEVGRERREEGGWIHERLRFRAHAFARGAVLVPGPEVRAWPVAGGEPRTARAPDLRLAVRSALAGAPEGEAELDLDLLDVPRRPQHWPWALAALAVLALWGGFARRRRRRVRPPAPHRAALRDLGELEFRSPGAREEAIQLSRLLRRYLTERFEVEAAGRTTEELAIELQRRRDLGENDRQSCADILRHCDEVKFRGTAVVAAERARIRRIFRDFVQRTGGDSRDA